jgi:hypothetical protein
MLAATDVQGREQNPSQPFRFFYIEIWITLRRQPNMIRSADGYSRVTCIKFKHGADNLNMVQIILEGTPSLERSIGAPSMNPPSITLTQQSGTMPTVRNLPR